MREKMLRPSPDDSVRDAQSKTGREAPRYAYRLSRTRKSICAVKHIRPIF
jgi:hypothetical protein